jgi:hypothetical protein
MGLLYIMSSTLLGDEDKYYKKYMKYYAKYNELKNKITGGSYYGSYYGSNKSRLDIREQAEMENNYMAHKPFYMRPNIYTQLPAESYFHQPQTQHPSRQQPSPPSHTNVPYSEKSDGIIIGRVKGTNKTMRAFKVDPGANDMNVDEIKYLYLKKARDDLKFSKTLGCYDCVKAGPYAVYLYNEDGTRDTLINHLHIIEKIYTKKKDPF